MGRNENPFWEIQNEKMKAEIEALRKTNDRRKRVDREIRGILEKRPRKGA